jgi:hypothetical protein
MKVSIKNSNVNELHQPAHLDIAAVALINQTVTTAAKKQTNFLQMLPMRILKYRHK